MKILPLPDDPAGQADQPDGPRRSALARLGFRPARPLGRAGLGLLLFAALAAAGAPNAAATVPPPASFVRQWGTYGSGPGQFSAPWGVAADGQDVYVVDAGRVERFTAGGMFLQSITGGTGHAWQYPVGVALNSPGHVFAGDIDVTDAGTDLVDKFTGFGGWIQAWGGPGQLNGPTGVAVDGAGDVYVADTWNDRVQEFNTYGGFIRAWGTTGTGPGQFSQPWGVAVDDAGNVYVSDSGNDRIQKFTSAGTFLTAWGTPGGGPGQFQSPLGIAVDESGYVYVADAWNDRIEQFASNGTFLQSWGTPGTGPGQFQGPIGVAAVSGSSATTGRSTTIFVTDGSDRVEEFYESAFHVIPCPFCH